MPRLGLLFGRYTVWARAQLQRGSRYFVLNGRLKLFLHLTLAVAGSGLIALLQEAHDYVAAPLFGLFFWCLVVTRTFGALPAAAAVLSAALVGNYVLLAPRGALTLHGEAGQLSALFVLFAGTAVGMFASSRRDVVAQRRRLRHEQQIVREHAGLARALSRALTARDVFLAVAGHELRSPVTAASMQAQAQVRRLSKKEPPVPEQLQAWQRQWQSLQRLLALVDGLLDVSRINSGQLNLELQKLDLARVVRDVTCRYSELAERVGCEVVVDVKKEVTGDFDRVRVEQVVANLLSNAFKYGAGQPVHLSLQEQDDVAVLRVKDHGTGISPADKKRIFDCFERVATDKNVAGLGLGLWIVRQIVSAQRGAIEVDSALGEGATFTVKLPLEPRA